MAEGLNKVLLIGNLGQNPELRYTQSNQAVLSLRMATNERFKNRSGEWQDRTEWHTVVVWGRRAEGLSKVVQKGTQLYVEGRLQTRNYEDKQGQKRYFTEVVAREIILLGRRGGGGGEDFPPPHTDDDFPGSTGPGGDDGGGGPDVNPDDDIPF